MKTISSQEFRLVPQTEIHDRVLAAKTWPVTEIFDLPLVCADRTSMARHIFARAGSGQKSTINFVNAHCVNIQRSDPEYRAALRASALLLPDGVGMEIAAKLSGKRLGQNLNGTDHGRTFTAENVSTPANGTAVVQGDDSSKEANV